MKGIILLLSLMSVILLGGCSLMGDRITDKYSFGEQVIREGASEIKLVLPFEIGKTTGKVTEAASLSTVTYRGQNRNIFILVVAQPVQGMEITAKTAGEQAIQRLKNTPTLSQLKDSRNQVMLGSVQAEKINVTYRESNAELGMLEYLFIDNGILWNIIYQYRPQNAESKELVAFIEDKISVVKKEG